MFKLSAQNERLQIFKESLFHASLCKHEEELSEKVIDCVDPYAELKGDSESFSRDTCPLLKLLNARVNVLSEKILHLLSEHLLSSLFVIWDSGKPDQLPVIDVQSCPQKHKPTVVVLVGLTNEI